MSRKGSDLTDFIRHETHSENLSAEARGVGLTRQQPITMRTMWFDPHGSGQVHVNLKAKRARRMANKRIHHSN